MMRVDDFKDKIKSSRHKPVYLEIPAQATTTTAEETITLIAPTNTTPAPAEEFLEEYPVTSEDDH